MNKCTICGTLQNDPEIKEWTYCPKEDNVICAKHCVNCKYHRKPEDISSIYCRKYIGLTKKPDKKELIRKLKNQIKNKEQEIDRLYSRSWVKKAREVESEVIRLRRELWIAEHGEMEQADRSQLI